ncbi:MAG: N-6 DNA methylase [Candidatus Competibacteraceae bacterium]|nr:N-6 DNA methylase [Candidatus Competibacteraceae bacterium]
MNELKYTDLTPVKYRKKFGQFFTPYNIADLMISWIIKDNPKSILDPAFGLGVFFDSLSKIGALQLANTIYKAYEIDPTIISYLDYGNGPRPIIEIADYLETDLQGYDAIVCNPPYMRFQQFLNRHRVLPEIEKKIGVKLDGYANIASVFLTRSLKELNAGGRLAYIIPFEFFNTGYGKKVKSSLLEGGLLKQIIFFSNEKDIFSEVITTVCILLCRKDGVVDPIKITQIDHIDRLKNIASFEDFFQYELAPDQLPFDTKWSPIISGLYETMTIPSGLSKIVEYGKFVRGIATGANEFFALSSQKISQWELGPENYCPCITKSPQIRKPIFTDDDFNQLDKGGMPIYCLAIQEHDNKKILAYLDHGVDKGFHQRFLTRHRNPWYKIESRSPAPILAGVFNRGRLKVIRNFTNAINFTCFHAFYPNPLGQNYTNRLFVYLMSDIGQNIVMTNKRRYGGNLDKFEPSDLNEGGCPSMNQFDRSSEAEALEVIEVAKVDQKKALDLANRVTAKIFNMNWMSMTCPPTSKPLI